MENLEDIQNLNIEFISAMAKQTRKALDLCPLSESMSNQPSKAPKL